MDSLIKWYAQNVTHSVKPICTHMAPLWTVSSNTNLAGMHPADRQAVIYGHGEQHREDMLLEAWHRNTGWKQLLVPITLNCCAFSEGGTFEKWFRGSLWTFWWVMPTPVAIFTPSQTHRWLSSCQELPCIKIFTRPLNYLQGEQRLLCAST